MSSKVVKIMGLFEDKKLSLNQFFTRVDLAIKSKASLPEILINSDFSNFPLEDRKSFMELLPKSKIKEDVGKFLKLG